MQQDQNPGRWARSKPMANEMSWLRYCRSDIQEGKTTRGRSAILRFSDCLRVRRTPEKTWRTRAGLTLTSNSQHKGTLAVKDKIEPKKWLFDIPLEDRET